MNFPKIMINKKKILVVSPIYHQIDKLEKIQNFADEYITIFTGEICYPYDDIKQIENRISILNNYLNNSVSFYVLGDADLVFKNKNKNNINLINTWLDNQCLGINVHFSNNTILTIVHGGIPLKTKKWEDLFINLEVAFVRNIENKPWHSFYDGRFGYVISAHPSSEEVEHYDYSTSIDIKGQVLAQEYGENGLLRTIFF